jgi:thymidylate synthase
MYQRSCDMLLGVPYNVASYSLLTCIIAAWLGIKPGSFTHMLGDAHIYNNHVTQVREIFERELIPSPRLLVDWPLASVLPKVPSPGSVAGFLYRLTQWPNNSGPVWGLWMPSETGNKAPSTLNLLDYNPHPAIKAPVAV